MNTLTLIYYKIIELMSTADPSTSGIMNLFGMKMLDLSNATDPGAIIIHIFETLFFLLGAMILLTLTFAYRLFMGLIGQPVPVPWF